MTYCFFEKDPNKAYISNNLLLPKAGINLAPIKTALTFTYGEEEIRDKTTGELITIKPGEMRLWDENKHHLIVPREFIPPGKYSQFDFEFQDIRPQVFPTVNLFDNIKLRDEDQAVAFHTLCNHHSGTLNLACGKGKTILALKLAAYFEVPTIVVVNTTALLEQWKKEAKKFLGLQKVGIIQGNTIDWEEHPIVLSMVHTLAQRREWWSMKFRRHFGLAIYDECFPAGTCIGETPIEELKIGDSIPSYDLNENQVVVQKITQVFKRPAASLVLVRTEGRTISCTFNHPFLVQKKEGRKWIPAGNLQRGDMVLCTIRNHENTLRPLRNSDVGAEEKRSEKNQLLERTRVDSVEVLQPGSDGTFGGLCPNGFVYNLEVENTHTYIANGFVVHNCHHMSAPVFVRSADLFFGRRYSLTATASRIDGLESIYQYHLGGIIHRNLKQELIPRTYFHRLKWEFDFRYKPRVSDSNGDFNFPRIRTYLGDLEWRNHIIGQDIIADYLQGRKLLVLSHSVEHINNLAQELLNWDLPCGVITGATPQESRMEILSDCNPVLGTFQLAREGLDKPSLDTLYIVTPFSSPNDLQQAWGRIQRQYKEKKEPLVRVYEDLAFRQCKIACRNLKKHLDDLRYPHQNRNINPEELYGALES